jgi:hypothetical protein
VPSDLRARQGVPDAGDELTGSIEVQVRHVLSGKLVGGMPKILSGPSLDPDYNVPNDPLQARYLSSGAFLFWEGREP